MIEQALEIMTLAHKGQTRWGGEPYIVHPLRVAARLAIYNDSNLVVLGLLHDVLEDCRQDHKGLFAQEIYRKFGRHIYDCLCTLTHKKSDDYDSYIELITLNHPDCARVKLADLADNMSDLKAGSARYQKYQNARTKLIEGLGHGS